MIKAHLADTTSCDPADVAFYAVTDSEHFVGLVALINSLRLVGHHERVVVTDLGMTPRQRSLLLSEAAVVDPPTRMHGVLAKPIAPLSQPSAVMVLLDADVIVVRHLGPLIECAARGKMVFFENDDPARYFDEWAALDMGRPERAPYVIAGHFLGPESLLVPLLKQLAELQNRIPSGAAHYDGGDISNPYFFADQDLLNAYLMTSVDSETIVRLDRTLSPVPPFTGYRLGAGLRCLGPDGLEPYLLHHFLGKPWLGSTRRNVYVDALRRALWHPSAPISIDRSSVPLRLRPSKLGRLELTRASTQSRALSIARGEHRAQRVMRFATARFHR
jgi:hypothetical protein